jgi:hypothetical protein
LTRRLITSVPRDKPEIIKPKNNPGLFFSSNFGGFNLDNDDETNQGTSFFRPASPSFGAPDQGPSFFRSAKPSFGAQSQGPSFFRATAPPSYGAAYQKPTEKTKSRNIPTVDSCKWSFNHTKNGPADGNTLNRKSVFRMSRLDLDWFNGNPRKCPTFITNFRDLVNDDQAISSNQKMGFLQSCLKPNI